MQAGAKMAYGTDAGVYPHGGNGKQFAKMVEWGMTPMQAIKAATVDAAELLGWRDRVGSVQTGSSPISWRYTQIRWPTSPCSST